MKSSIKVVSIVLLCLLFLPPSAFAGGWNSFKTVTYTGNGAIQKITGVGFKPDLVWIKSRNSAVNRNHMLFDSLRGPTRAISSNAHDIEDISSGYLTSFDNNGFTLSNSVVINQSGYNFVAWCWKADQPGITDATQEESFSLDSGLSIIKYTGDGVSGRTLSHSLGSKPKFVVIKGTSVGYHWVTSGASFDGGTDNLHLNLPHGNISSSVWHNTPYTSSDITLSNSEYNNNNGVEYIAYVFSEVSGVSSIGTYVGNGSPDGPVIHCGFQPAFVMIKRTDAVGDWPIFDDRRDILNPKTKYVVANKTDYEVTGHEIDFLSNGFQIKSTTGHTNFSNGSYIYIAFSGFSHDGNMTINGNVGIGKLNPKEALEVNGTIKAKEIIVTNDGWPDYVFDKKYKLQDLESVENYINENHHLPGVPSANQIKTDGISVSRMLELQMQKIEELTLHIIKLEKRLKELE